MSACLELVNWKGDEYMLEFDYQPPEDPCGYYPGCPEEIELTSVRIKDSKGEWINADVMLQSNHVSEELTQALWESRELSRRLS